VKAGQRVVLEFIVKPVIVVVVGEKKEWELVSRSNTVWHRNNYIIVASERERESSEREILTVRTLDC
jgi:hypothetical protein